MISSSDITVVVQGAMYSYTPLVISSIKRLLPDSPIILSTWEGEVVNFTVEGMCVILNRDPYKKGIEYPSNVNRMIVSTLAGLKAVQTKYVLKTRTDFYIKNLNFLKLFEENPNTNCGMRFLEKRVVCYGWAPQNGRYLQIGDFYHFGLIKDVLDIWDVPLMSDEELFWFKKNKPYNSFYLTDVKSRYHPEQWIWINFLRKKGVLLDFTDYTDTRDKFKKLSEDSFADNLIFSSFNEFAVFAPKFNLVKYNIGGGIREYGFLDWIKLVKKRSPHYQSKIELSICSDRIKSKIGYILLSIIRIISSAIPQKRKRSYFRSRFQYFLVKKMFFSPLGTFTSRVFNETSCDESGLFFVKKSTQISKLMMEKKWYERIPKELQKYSPKVFALCNSNSKAELILECLANPSISFLFTKEKLSQKELNSTLESLFKLHAEFASFKCKSECDFKGIYIDKTLKRVDAIANSSLAPLILSKEFVLNGERMRGFPEIKDNLLMKLENIAVETSYASIIHGDFCFSNILFDKEAKTFKLVDPRGSFGCGFSIYGDSRYDIAKLRHSFVGLYDFIVAGKFSLRETKCEYNSFKLNIFTNYNKHDLESFFDSLVLSYGFKVEDIKLIEAVLFLSMIPLHNESEIRQKAFLLLALKKLNDIL